MIRLDRLGKSFDGGDTFAVRDVSLEVAEGETLVLLGSSGSGKSTTLKMINRLLEPTEGRVELDGRPVGDVDPVTLRRSIGYVFQEIGLFPHMTVEENVGVVPRMLGWTGERRGSRTEDLLTLVGLPPERFRHRFPDELSGGQRQRVGVARALAADPAHLLMDEPFGALDAVTRDRLRREFVRLQERLGKTVVFVTHDILEAVDVADRIAILHRGRLQQVGTLEEVVREPATDFVQDLFDRSARQLQAFADLLG